MTALITALHAQKKQQKPTGYAITAAEKGGQAWKEVRQVDMGSGEELQRIYESAQDLQPLNARTGKPVVKKEVQNETITRTVRTPDPVQDAARVAETAKTRKVVNLDEALAMGNSNTHIVTRDNLQTRIRTETRQVVVIRYRREAQDKPFSTNSAAMAYDKKHERLYYTPMGINQLRYIDLKGKSPKLYYFEDEPFGVVSGMGDVHNQVTRMVIASDGNGYALTNDARHLVQFTTGKKPVITDLGTLTDDPANGANSVHSAKMYGGDMIADANKNLYLVTAYRRVFKISLDSRVATYLGMIKGLPEGFSTNGAMVEEGSKVIVASSRSTAGYYRFDLVTLEAEKMSGENTVFNASDLANGNLAFDKKKKDKEQPENPEVTTPPVVTEDAAGRKNPAEELAAGKGISVFPNPVTSGFVKLSFDNQPAGRYQVQLLDLSGKLIRAQEVNIGNKVQVEELRMPELSVKGNYLIRVTGANNQVSFTNKIVVQ